MEFLNSVLAVFDTALSQAGIIAVVIEFIFRLIPSEKPLGILHLVGAFAKVLGNIFLKMGELLDRVLPQVLK